MEVVIVSISGSNIKMLHKPLRVQERSAKVGRLGGERAGFFCFVFVVPTREWLLAVINGINEDNLGNAFFCN